MNKKLIFIFAIVCVLAISFWNIRTKDTKKISLPIYKGSYVAMGDSVAAGVGLLDDSDSSACDRTNESYPNQVARTLNYKLKNLACSGATLSEGILGSQDVNKLQTPSQLQRLFQDSKPTLITLTIGANDAQWINIISKCYNQTCGSVDDTATVETDLETVHTNLQTVLDRIKTHYASSPPQVLVTGYHQVFPSTLIANCNDLTNIDATELTWLRQLQTQLNTTLQTTLKDYTFATFVPVNFTGHELCTSDPWVQGLSDTQPYHPTARGQIEYAQQIKAVVKMLQ